MDNENETAQFTGQCIEYLDSVLQDIQGFGDDVYILNKGHLAGLNIRTAERLDIEEQSVDFGPRFFCPRFTLEQARQKTTDFLANHADHIAYHIWPPRCSHGSYVGFEVDDSSPGPRDPDERHPLCNLQTDAEFRQRWFLAVMGADYYNPWAESTNLGTWEGSEWFQLPECDLVPGQMGNLPHHGGTRAQVGHPPRPYTFHVSRAFLIEELSTDTPHIGGTVVDSTEAEEGDVLRCEVAAAVGLLKHQFRRGDFCKHHTLPAIVFSFQHDSLGRVSQFHFDGRALVLRQSRLLNFRSDEPTTDAYHMIRWMANRPMGETRFQQLAAEEGEDAGHPDMDKNNGKLPVEGRGS
ncbi:hypothetical protein C8A01DRAFT_19695 [Parachaetomium inaequale]|uniref:Uncharacterized protein n=1 Tax=Parachaetomium inaequale TaxID=2588326 RepID=A0AAN6P7Z2_9PEZI|nr:hypothetical protein C8A01DRAFT_19695 [Parachaetomium inaequale]